MSTFEIKVLTTVKEPSGNLTRIWEVSETFKSYVLMKSRYQKLKREKRNTNRVMFVDDKPLYKDHIFLEDETDVTP